MTTASKRQREIADVDLERTLSSELVKIRRSCPNMLSADELVSEMDELRRACANLLGEDEETWPSHGNAPLAIASALALALSRLRQEQDPRNVVEKAIIIAGMLPRSSSTTVYDAAVALFGQEEIDSMLKRRP